MTTKENTFNDANVTEIILESISDGVFTVNYEWQIMSFNRGAEKITGIQRNEAIGRYCWEVFRSNMCEKNCLLKKTMKEGKSYTSSSAYIINSEKNRVPIDIATALLKNAAGEILGGVETFRDKSIEEELRREINGGYHQGGIVTCSSKMKSILSTLPQIAESNASVLIEGETGTGKEILAKAIHDLSSRIKKPFITINCGALPDTLLESELFGYKKGAFTGAEKDKTGYFYAANGGTILLDEIGETSQAFQVKLLRILQEKTFQPLGSVEKVAVDVRIITSTNRNLTEMVTKGSFRQDLYYRINIVRLKLPSLRERKEDIPLLVKRFIEKMNRLRGKAISGITDKALSHLMHQSYPGNIRELENIIEHAFVLCSQGKIRIDHLPEYITGQHIELISPSTMASGVQKKEVEIIVEALERNNYNRVATANNLGIHKSTLFRKIKKFNISLPEKDGRSSTITSD